MRTPIAERLRRFRRLDGAERRALLRAQLALLAAQWTVWTRPTGALLAPGATSPGPRDVEPSADVLARAVSRAARHGLFRPRCLTRAVALQRLLAREGIGAAVRVGVRRAGRGFDAHAWVEVGGRPLGEAAGWQPMPVSVRGGGR